MGLCKFTRFFANVQLYICVLAKWHADVQCGMWNYSKELRAFRDLKDLSDLKDLRDFKDFRGR